MSFELQKSDLIQWKASLKKKTAEYLALLLFGRAEYSVNKAGCRLRCSPGLRPRRPLSVEARQHHRRTSRPSGGEYPVQHFAVIRTFASLVAVRIARGKLILRGEDRQSQEHEDLSTTAILAPFALI